MSIKSTLYNQILEEHKKTGISLLDICIKKGTSQKEIALIFSKQLHIPYINLTEKHINYNLFHLIPFSILRKYRVIPIKKKNNTIFVVTSDPLDVSMIDELKSITGYDIELRITTKRRIEEVLQQIAIQYAVSRTEDEKRTKTGIIISFPVGSLKVKEAEELLADYFKTEKFKIIDIQAGPKNTTIKVVVEKFKYRRGHQTDMKSLYDKLKREEKYFKPDAPTNFTVGFYTEKDGGKGLSIAAKYGSVIGKPGLGKPTVGCSLIISRTQLLALKDAGIKFSPTYDKCFAKRIKE